PATPSWSHLPEVAHQLRRADAVARGFGDRTIVDRAQEPILVRGRDRLPGRKRAAAALRRDVTCLIQLAVGARDRVRVDRELPRELVDRRQLLVALERSGGQRGGDRVVDLAVDRDAAVVVDRELERHPIYAFTI